MRDLTGKIYKRRPILLLSLTLLFTQCMREEVIEDFTEVRESPAAVYCVLTPGEYIQVLLFRSVAFFDSTAYFSEDLVIYDADIRIFNDHGDTVRLQNPSSDGGYAYNVPIQYGSYTALQSDLPIQAGETYHLLVNIANGTELLRASTSVPKEAVQWDSFEIYNRRPSPRPTYPNEYKNPVYVIDTIADVRGSWSNQGAETRLVFTGYSHPLRMERAYEGFNDPYYIRTTDCCKHLMIEGYRLYDGRTSSHDGGYFTVVTLNPELEAYLRVYDLFEEDRTNIGFGLFLRLFNGVYPEYTNIEGGLGLFAAHLSDARAI